MICQEHVDEDWLKRPINWDKIIEEGQEQIVILWIFIWIIILFEKASYYQMPIEDHMGNDKSHNTISVRITDLEMWTVKYWDWASSCLDYIIVLSTPKYLGLEMSCTK